jgi:copper chaperone CopZ
MAAAPALAGTYSYHVNGMHCEECAKSVSAQVCKLDGVTQCDVKVGTVTLTTEGDKKIDQKAVEKALAKAGNYKIAKEKVAEKAADKTEAKK